jgi:large subunit ribosomal protein L16
MKFPKRTKYRKYQKNISIKKITNKSTLYFGKFGIKFKESLRLHPKTIEALRRIYGRKFRRKAKIRINSFPTIPVTEKSSESRMGKGKGAVQYWVCPLKRGQILFQIKKVNKIAAKQVSKTLPYKIGKKLKFISKSIDQWNLEYTILSQKNFPEPICC